MKSITNFILSVIVAAFLVVGCDGSSPDQPIQPLNVIHYGDSTVNQLGGLVGQKINGTYTNRSSDGQTAYDAIDGFHAVTGKPFVADLIDMPRGSVIILNWCINEALNGRDMSAWYANTMYMAKSATDVGMVVLLQLPNPILADYGNGAPATVENCATTLKSQSTYPVIQRANIDWRMSVSHDGIHPNETGRNATSQTIAEFLNAM